MSLGSCRFRCRSVYPNRTLQPPLVPYFHRNPHSVARLLTTNTHEIRTNPRTRRRSPFSLPNQRITTKPALPAPHTSAARPSHRHVPPHARSVVIRRTTPERGSDSLVAGGCDRFGTLGGETRGWDVGKRCGTSWCEERVIGM